MTGNVMITMRTEARFEKIISSGIYEVKLLIAEAMRYIDGTGDDSDDKRNDIRLIVSELLLNALYHGNKEQNAKKIILSIEHLKKDRFLIEVEDEGKGLSRKTLNQKRSLAVSRKPDFEEHGRGLILVAKLTGGIFAGRKGRKIRAKMSMSDKKS